METVPSLYILPQSFQDRASVADIMQCPCATHNFIYLGALCLVIQAYFTLI